MLAGEVEQHLAGHALPAAQLDRCRGNLSEANIRNSDYARLAHGGMGAENTCHIHGHDLESAAQDRVIGAARDPHEPILVDAGEIRGAHPLAAGTDLEQARLAQGHDPSGYRVDDSQLAARLGATDAAALAFAPLAVQRQRPARHTAGELGGAVRGQHWNTVLLLEGELDLGIELGRARRHQHSGCR